MTRKLRHQLLLLASLGAAIALVAGCGSSSKPAYCSSVENLKTSIKELPSTNVLQNGVSSLEDAVAKVKRNAQAVVDNAQSDFPDETGALKNSVDSLSNTVDQLSSSPTPAVLAQVVTEISAVVAAVDNFSKTTASKCG